MEYLFHMENTNSPEVLAAIEQLDRILQETSSVKREITRIETVVHNYDEYIFTDNTDFNPEHECKKFWMREILKRSREKNKKDSESNPEA